MGLGKTLQALALLQKAKEIDGPQPTLVIAPTTVVFNWEAEIQKFTPDLTCLKISGADRKALFKEIPNHDIIITSYALVRRDMMVYQLTLNQRVCWRGVRIPEGAP